MLISTKKENVGVSFSRDACTDHASKMFSVAGVNCGNPDFQSSFTLGTFYSQLEVLYKTW